MTRVALVLILLFTGSCGATASRIALRVEPAVTIESNRLAATVGIYNWGNEDADDVTVEMTCNALTLRAGTIGALRSGQATNILFSASTAPTLPGAYPVITRTRYTDALGYPASLVKVTILETSPAATSSLRISLQTQTVSRGGVGEAVVVMQGGDHPLTGTLRLHLPDELVCDMPVQPFSLAANGRTQARFHIRNAHGLPGSGYRCSVVAEWSDGDGVPRAAAADDLLRVRRHMNPLQAHRWTALLAAVACLLCFGVAVTAERRRPVATTARPHRSAAFVGTLSVFVILAWFMLDHLPVAAIFADTTLAGGDTVAHSYMAQHLRQQLLTQGRIVSWAPEWWCGFPLFQYYFPLPYLAMAALSFLAPMNVAIKLVSVLGIVLLPVAAFCFGRALKLPRPGPLLLAIATIPFLFDHSHTMWGVNVYSTLSGMIANSLSFAIMLLFLSGTLHDAETGRVRIRTIAWLCLLIGSHFFTSLMAALTVSLIPLLFLRRGFKQALRVVVLEGLAGGLLMAWWLVPLVAKRAFSVDFGANWKVTLLTSLPPYLWALLPFAAAGIVSGLVTRRFRYVALPLWMAGCSGVLFVYGHALSPVFVNVRLWPFFAFALLILGAGGIGLLVARARGTGWVVAAALLAALSFGIDSPNHVRAWAEWNFEGLERKPRWPVLETLVLPLDGTPGRLANDLHAANNSLGSSRVFESVPYLIDKPILEGGIVNSALGSYAAYYVQSETSETCAGYPPLVQPSTQSMARAALHLPLFNVKHFIARGEKTRAMFAAHPDWLRTASAGPWELYENTRMDGRHVVVLDQPPACLVTKDPARAGLQWLYHTNRLHRPVVLLPPDPQVSPCGPVLEMDEFNRQLEVPPEGDETAAWITNSTPVTCETVDARRITFHTTAIGRPHVVKCSYFPNWKVRGGGHVYRVTPGFMLVVPCREQVELYYGRVLSDTMGQLLSLAGAAFVAAVLWRERRKHGGNTTHANHPDIRA